MVDIIDPKDDEIIIGKITDFTSAIIRLIISILKLLKINTPKSAESGIGLITLLIFIYWSADILKFDKSTHMLIFYAIFIIVIFEIIGYNSSKISKIFSKESKVDNLIKEIIEGNITSDQAYTKIIKSNLNAENIDDLLVELTGKNLLSEKIQKAIISSQYLNIKNVNTLFNTDSSIFLTDELMLELLNKPEIQGALNEEHIMKIFEDFKEKLSDKISENTKIEFKMKKQYNANPLFIHKYCKNIDVFLRLVVVIIVIIPLIYTFYKYYSVYPQSQSEININIIIMAGFFVYYLFNIYISKKILNFFIDRFSFFVTEKIKSKQNELKNLLKADSNT